MPKFSREEARILLQRIEAARAYTQSLGTHRGYGPDTLEVADTLREARDALAQVLSAFPPLEAPTVVPVAIAA